MNDNDLNFSPVIQSKEMELEVTRQEYEETKAKVSSLENTKGWLERRLNETEVCIPNFVDQ